MFVVWLIVGILLVALGILGAILPILPGLPISYLGLLLLHFTKVIYFPDNFLWIALILLIVAQALDYFVPLWTTKYFGGSKWGVWGCFVGMIVGIAFGTLGVILGPIVGAIVGELISGKKANSAIKSGVGSFVGFLGGIVLKMVVGGYYLFEIFTNLNI